MSKPTTPPPVEEVEIARKTRRSLLVGGVAAVAGAGVWEWLRSRRPDEGVAWPLRVALRANEGLSRDYFRPARLARTYAASAVNEPRQNGDIGLGYEVDPNWKLALELGPYPGQPVQLGLDEIKTLEKVEMITELNCIEGWTRIIKWGGVRFRDFAAKYAPKAMDAS